MVNNNFLDITGARYGKLVVISKTNTRRKSRAILWKCICECGGEILASSFELKTKHITSCGCVRWAALGVRVTKHGACVNSKLSTIYKMWMGILSRCTWKGNVSYKNYGGRGIKVHPPWKESYVTFETYILENIGHPKKGQSLDRIDSDKNYEPENLRWATHQQQNYNKPKWRNCITTSKFKGVSYCASRKKWKAQIGHNRKTYQLGRYVNEEDAARAYNKAALELHGEFARLNIL